MKTAIYIEAGTTQLVFTPETEWEKAIIRGIEEGSQTVTIKRGSFYETRGGWTREGSSDESLILRIVVNAKDEHGCPTVIHVAT